MTAGGGHAPHVLLVDDNEGDVILVREAFALAAPRCRLSVCADGTEGLSFLRRDGDFAGAERPDLVLLDLNLPRLDGYGLLEVVKTDPGLRRIPVVVLTGSRAERDVVRCYEGHANACVVKPAGLEEFVEAVSGLCRFWFEAASLPPP